MGKNVRFEGKSRRVVVAFFVVSLVVSPATFLRSEARRRGEKPERISDWPYLNLALIFRANDNASKGQKRRGFTRQKKAQKHRFSIMSRLL
jgi:hypothetical protein